MPIHVVVVGAGVAGLQTARALTKRGCSVLLLEQSYEVGGVWSRGYSGFGLQVPAEYYQFGEFPWPDDLPREEYPSGASVHRYCHAYAEHFGLLPLVRYGCRLVRLRARRPHGWRVVYECADGPEGAAPSSSSCGLRGAPSCSSPQRQASLVAVPPGGGGSVASSSGGLAGPSVGVGGGSSANSAQPILSFSQGVGANNATNTPTSPQQQKQPRLWRVDADYVVVATGIYALPQLPSYRDAQRFQGLVMHAKDFRDPVAVRGRHVLVVGAGKSALDVGGEVAASRSAASITWLMRQAHWPVPRTLRLAGAPVPAARLIFSGASPSLLLPPYYDAGVVRRAVGALAAPLKRLAWRFIERAVVRQFGLRGPLLPKLPLRDDLFFGGQILDATWTRLVQYGATGGGVRSSLNDGAESVSIGVGDRGGGGRSGGDAGGGSAALGGGGGGVGRAGRGGWRSRGSRGSGGRGGSSGGYRSGDAPPGSGGGSAGRACSSGDELGAAADGAAGAAASSAPASAPASRQPSSSSPMPATMPPPTDLAPSPSHSHPLPTVAEGPADAALLVSPFSAAAATVAAGGGAPAGVLILGNGGGVNGGAVNPSSAALSQQHSYPHHHHAHFNLPADACGDDGGAVGSDPFSSAGPTAARPKCCHVRPLLGEIARFVPRGVVLRSGEEVYCDAVLMCTGYQKTYDYLDGSLKARLGLQKDGLWLYRHVLAPLVPGLAFIGAEASTFNNVLTSGLQAEWLAATLCGRLAPGREPKGVEAMLADVRRQQAWRRRVMPVQHGRGACVQMYAKCYHDQLLRDLGLEEPGACGGGGWRGGKAAGPAARAAAFASSSRPSTPSVGLGGCFRPLTAEDYAHAFVPPDLRHPYDDEDEEEEEEQEQQKDVEKARARQQQAGAADGASAPPPLPHPHPNPKKQPPTDAAAAAASAAEYWRAPPPHLLLQPPGSFVVRERLQRQQRAALVAALVGAPPPDGRDWTRAEPAEPADLAGAGTSDASGVRLGGGGLPSAASLMPGAAFVGGGGHVPSSSSPFSFAAALGGGGGSFAAATAPAYSGGSLSGPSGVWRPPSAAMMMSPPQQMQMQHRPMAAAQAGAGGPPSSNNTNTSRPPTTTTTSGALGRDSSTLGHTSASDPHSSGPLPPAAFVAPAPAASPPPPPPPPRATGALAAAPPAATPAATRTDPRAAAALASLRAWHAASPAAAAADRLIASAFPQPPPQPQNGGGTPASP